MIIVGGSKRKKSTPQKNTDTIPSRLNSLVQTWFEKVLMRPKPDNPW